MAGLRIRIRSHTVRSNKTSDFLQIGVFCWQIKVDTFLVSPGLVDLNQNQIMYKHRSKLTEYYGQEYQRKSFL